MRPFAVKRVEPRQQAVDFKSKWKIQHIADDARLRLRDVDRLLLLKDAALHADIADPMAGAGAHRIIEHDHRQRRDRLTALAEQVHLRNSLFERTAGQLDTERVAGASARLVAKAVRARILLARVT